MAYFHTRDLCLRALNTNPPCTKTCAEMKVSMDIPALSISLNSIDTGNNSTDTGNDIAVAVLAKGLEMLDIEGESLKKMMELSVEPSIGQNIDISL